MSVTELCLSTCWNSHRHVDGRAMLEEIAALGFTAVELGHGTRFSLWPGILAAAEEKTVSIRSLHNFCPLPVGFTRPSPNCYEFSDPDAHVRARALRHTKETIHHAHALGAKTVVLHLGSSPQPPVTPWLEEAVRQGRLADKRFIRRKLDALRRQEAFFARCRGWLQEALMELGEIAERCGVRLGLENRERVEELPNDDHWEAIIEDLPPSVGFWHDFGHAARKQALGLVDHRRLLERTAGRLVGCHVHDCRPPHQDHLPPGDGVIDFSRLWPCLRKAPDSYPVFVLELSPRVPKARVKESLQWWKCQGPVSSGA